MENEEDWRKKKWGGKKEEVETWDNEVDEEKTNDKGECVEEKDEGKNKCNEKLKVKGEENVWRWGKGKGKIQNKIRIGIKLSGWEKGRKYGKKILTKIQTKVWERDNKGECGRKKENNKWNWKF